VERSLVRPGQVVGGGGTWRGGQGRRVGPAGQQQEAAGGRAGGRCSPHLGRGRPGEGGGNGEGRPAAPNSPRAPRGPVGGLVMAGGRGLGAVRGRASRARTNALRAARRSSGPRPSHSASSRRTWQPGREASPTSSSVYSFWP
jgi:hypothetical protein